MKTKIFSVIVAFLLLVSCSKDDDSQTFQSEPTGTLTGKVMVSNGTKPVGGALVFILNDQSKLYYTRTDAAGNFSLKAPVGNRKLHIQTGGGANFRTEIAVTVSESQTLSIDPAQTRLLSVAKMAYVVGDYDSIQSIVTNLGYTITPITNANLEDYSLISQYDVIFLNCGAKEGNSAVADANLASFVTNGGSIYASDWAVAYLMGGESNTEQCGESGGFIPDDKLCALASGDSQVISGATVTDSNLAAALGFSSLDIEYNLPGWEEINSFDPAFWDVMVSNPVNNVPLMIKTNHFSGGTSGAAVGLSAADEGWITICHHESESDPITITIAQEDWAAHEAHGDSIGECSNSNNSGTIYYTTFHNHADGNIGNAGLILQYVILNL